MQVFPSFFLLGGIAEQEAPIHVSNLMLICPNCGPSRVGHKFEGDKKVRVCKKCDQVIETKGKKK